MTELIGGTRLARRPRDAFLSILPDRRCSPTQWYLPAVLVARHPVPLRDADDGVDVTLIRWMLSLSPAGRGLQGFADSVAELTHDSPATKVQRST
jgi:hypothetical protein